MKIVQVCNDFLPSMGGIPIDMYEQDKRLVQQGYDVTILTTNVVGWGNKPSDLPIRETIDGIQVGRFRVLPIKALSKLFIAPSIIKDLLSIKADVIHVFSFLPTFVTITACLMAKLRGLPLIRTPVFHPYRFRIYDSLLEKWIKILHDDLVGLYLLKMSDKVIALTTTEADYYLTKGVRNVQINPIGVDLTERKVGSQRLKRFRRRYRLNDPFILFVGRIEKRKGFDFLMESLPAVLKKFPGIKIVLAGDKFEDRKELSHLVGKNGLSEVLVSLGRIEEEELECAYEAADILIIPSRYEAFSRVIIEAWAHKKPVITTRNVGLAEVITPENAVSVDYGDTDALAEGIIRLLSNPSVAKKMGENGYKIVKKHFVWPAIVTELKRAYQETRTSKRKGKSD